MRGAGTWSFVAIIFMLTNHLQNEDIPSMSDANNMGVDEIPRELADLNMYETVLIQRARAFLVIQFPYVTDSMQNIILFSDCDPFEAISV